LAGCFEEMSEEFVVKIGEPVLTRYERARIVGARALQISHGAPVLIDIEQDDFRPHDVANKELKARVLPIGLSRRVPNGSPQNIPVFLLKDREFMSQIDKPQIQTMTKSSSDGSSEKSTSSSKSSADMFDVAYVTENSIDDFKEAGFDTVEKLAAAKISSLTKISGIGKTTAEKIIESAKELLE